MALPLFCKRLGNDLGLEALFGIHLLEPLVFLFKLLHPGHQRGVHAAELGPPFVERGRAHAMLAAQFGDGGAGFSLFEDGDNLAVGVTGDLHAELSKSYLENSTHKSACLQGGLPLEALLPISKPSLISVRITAMPSARFAVNSYSCAVGLICSRTAPLRSMAANSKQ